MHDRTSHIALNNLKDFRTLCNPGHRVVNSLKPPKGERFGANRKPAVGLKQVVLREGGKPDGPHGRRRRAARTSPQSTSGRESEPIAARRSFRNDTSAAVGGTPSSWASSSPHSCSATATFSSTGNSLKSRRLCCAVLIGSHHTKSTDLRPHGRLLAQDTGTAARRTAARRTGSVNRGSASALANTPRLTHLHSAEVTQTWNTMRNSPSGIGFVG